MKSIDHWVALNCFTLKECCIKASIKVFYTFSAGAEKLNFNKRRHSKSSKEESKIKRKFKIVSWNYPLPLSSTNDLQIISFLACDSSYLLLYNVFVFVSLIYWPLSLIACYCHHWLDNGWVHLSIVLLWFFNYILCFFLIFFFFFGLSVYFLLVSFYSTYSPVLLITTIITIFLFLLYFLYQEHFLVCYLLISFLLLPVSFIVFHCYHYLLL